MRKILMLGALVIGCGSLFAITFTPSEVEHKQPLKMADMKANPMDQFQEWYQTAQQKMGELEASTFVLGTVNSDCEPSTRSMLAKMVDKDGFAFFGDMNSEKMEQLSANPAAAATFCWFNEQRQINVMGKVSPVSEKEARMEFDKRSKMAQITSHVSKQGEEMKDPNKTQQMHDNMSEQYKNKQVPMPQNWGGYRLDPEVIEFWQAGPNNMHSRVLYQKTPNGQWEKKTLSP